MQSIRRTMATLIGGGVLVAACSGGGVTPSPPSATFSPAGPTPTVAPPTIAPTPTAVAMTDGQGPEHFSQVSGTEPFLEVQYTQKLVGDVLQYRGGVAAWNFTTTDPRMQGHASFAFSLDAYGSLLGPEWGTIRITSPAGAWTGTCTAATWDGGQWIIFGCWLVGGGAYEGLTAYYSLSDLESGVAMEGVIYPGSPPNL